MEIINWLRGSTIAIITLVRSDNSGIPKEFANKPLFTQWIYSQNDDIVKHINGLVEGLATAIAMDEGGVDHVEIEQNDNLRDQTPDCGLVVDIAGKNGLYFRIYATNFVQRPGKGWI
jgi:hypothetical protein